MDGGESREELEKHDIGDLESSNVHVQATDRQEKEKTDIKETATNAPTAANATNAPSNDGVSEEELWPGIRGKVEASENKSEESCIWPDHLDRSACFSCPACQYEEKPGAAGQHEKRSEGFFANLSEAEEHVKKKHGVSEDVYESIYLPEDQQSLTPLKCKPCKPSIFLCPSEQQLKEHMKSAHSPWHASQVQKFSKRVCRFCLVPIEQEKECSVSECKLLIGSFAVPEQSKDQEQTSASSSNLLIGTLLVIIGILVAILAIFIFDYVSTK